jgi:pimeloyl-ACP methyl ester carboxylesterase
MNPASNKQLVVGGECFNHFSAKEGIPMPTITTNDGVKLYYEDKGKGRPLIMIPGWTCTHNFFKKNIDELAKSCRVIAVEMRAHGDSEKVMWGHRISRYAKDVKDLIEALELEGVVLLGWSMGASIIWSYIDMFCYEHLAGHVSVDQSPRQYYSETWRWGQPGCYDAEALAILTIRLEYDPKSVARGLVPACFGDTPPTPEDVEFLAGEIDKCPPKVRAEIMADHTHLDWRDLFPQIKLPVLVCVGRQSKVFPWQGSAYVGEHIPGAKTVFFENSGHMPFYEEPEKFNQVVRDFVLGLG